MVQEIVLDVDKAVEEARAREAVVEAADADDQEVPVFVLNAVRKLITSRDNLVWILHALLVVNQ